MTTRCELRFVRAAELYIFFVRPNHEKKKSSLRSLLGPELLSNPDISGKGRGRRGCVSSEPDEPREVKLKIQIDTFAGVTYLWPLGLWGLRIRKLNGASGAPRGGVGTCSFLPAQASNSSVLPRLPSPFFPASALFLFFKKASLDSKQNLTNDLLVDACLSR